MMPGCLVQVPWSGIMFKCRCFRGKIKKIVLAALQVWTVFFFYRAAASGAEENVNIESSVSGKVRTAENKLINPEAFVLAKEGVTSEEKIAVDCFADYLEYDEASGIINGRGRVKVSYKGTDITADQVRFDVKSSVIEANGNITLKDNGSTITGEHVLFNMKNKTGIIDKITLSSGPWFFKGKLIEKPDEKNASIIEGFATTCNDKEHPHYRLISQKIHVELDNIVESWNVLLYVGDIPIFYFPYIWRSLKTSPKSPLTIRPGVSSSEGASLKLAYNYDFSEYLSGALMLDFMSKKGSGYGLQQNYRFSDGLNGGYLFAYYILEQDTLHERLRIDFDHSSRINNNLSIVARLNYLSDEALTKDYYSYYYPVVARDIRSYVAVSYYDPLFSIITAVDRQDRYDPVNAVYRISSLNLPSLRFSTTSMAIGNTNAYWFLNADLNYYLPDVAYNNRYYILKVGLHPSFTHVLKLDQANTFNTTAVLDVLTQDKPDYGYSGFLNSLNYSIALNLNSRWNKYVDTDLNYNYSQKLSGVGSDYYGEVLNNRLNGRLNLRIGEAFSNTLYTGYDFRAKNVEVQKKFDNLVNSTNIYISEEFNAFLNIQYSLAEGAMKAMDIFSNYGKPSGTKASLGLNYINNSPNYSIFDIFGSIAFSIGEDMRFEYGARFDTVTVKFKEHRFAFSTNITDCLYWDINFTNNNGLFSFGFNIQLRAFKESALDKKISPEVFKY